MHHFSGVIKSGYVLIYVVILAMAISCSPSEPFEEESKDISSLEGSWELIKYREPGSPEWKEYEEGIIYQKHITPTHFTWFYYDRVNDNLEGAGGGTYKFDGFVYTEDIDFFHPPGSSLLGQSIPFDVSYKDGIWYHTGYSKDLVFDAELGELVILDTTKIEEQWVKFSGETDTFELLGTWDLAGYRSNLSESTYSEYPDFVGYMKLITPISFVWIRYHNEEMGGEIIGLGSGTWAMDEGKYMELIEVMHPSGTNQVNTKIGFNFSLKENKWFHTGYVISVEEASDGTQIVLDSMYVDEVWEHISDQQ